MSQLDKLLSTLEKLIDIDHVKESEDIHKKALTYEKVPFPPLTLSASYPQKEFHQYPYSETFQNPEKMMVNELLYSFANIYQSAQIKDHSPFGIRSNYGVGIIASMFGLQCKIIEDNMPWVQPVEDIEHVKEIIENGEVDIRSGLGKKVLDTNLFYREKLSKFPKCAQVIHITQPDLQGPFNIAELILGDKIYHQVYEAPKIVYALLDVITETYINFFKEVKSTTTDCVGNDFICIHGAIYRGNCLLKDDSSINISPKMYHEIVEPYNRKILDKIDGGGIHSCGNRDPWRDNFLEIPGIKCLDFGDPQLNGMEEWYEAAKTKGVAIPRFKVSEEQLFNKTFRNRFRTGVSFFINVNSLKKAENLLRKYLYFR